MPRNPAQLTQVMMEREECGIICRRTHCWADDSPRAYLITGLNNSHRHDLVVKGETGEMTRSVCRLESGQDENAGWRSLASRWPCGEGEKISTETNRWQNRLQKVEPEHTHSNAAWHVCSQQLWPWPIGLSPHTYSSETRSSYGFPRGLHNIGFKGLF